MSWSKPYLDDEDIDDCQPNQCVHGGTITDLGLWNRVSL